MTAGSLIREMVFLDFTPRGCDRIKVVVFVFLFRFYIALGDASSQSYSFFGIFHGVVDRPVCSPTSYEPFMIGERFYIPLRWSISHLYQAILNNEKHVKDIKVLTTLAGYVHWQITGEKVLGIGDASGKMCIRDRISFVTNLAAPMGIVLKNQFDVSNALAVGLLLAPMH